jgi:curved DNA-binding protein
MQPSVFADHYEVLQISPNAEPETIHRVYRILAQRYHPDNPETGDSELFRSISDAYRALSDPEQRAAYDVQHREMRRLTWKIFDQTNSAQGIEAEHRKRDGLLALLYRKRVATPDQPQMTLKEFEDLLGVPKEHLEFSLWYLKEGQYVQRGDNGRHSITLKGVDLAEALAEKKAAAYADRPHEAPILPAAGRATEARVA